MMTEVHPHRELLKYMWGICIFATVMMFCFAFMTNNIIVRYNYHSVIDSIPPKYFHSHSTNTISGLEVKSKTNIPTRSTSHVSPEKRILVVSMSNWWENATTLPRTVTCKDCQISAHLEKVNISNVTDLKQADILLFTSIMRNRDLWLQLHRQRDIGQLWVFSSGESAFYNRESIPPRNMSYIRFNVTSTYHPGATIQVPYGQFLHRKISIEKKQEMERFVSNLYDEKEKLIVWVSSHCVTEMWRRIDLVHDLAKLIPVDMYGKCGQLFCSIHGNCKDTFEKYKFVIAFENSCCGGYITEKFWNALNKFHAIPVVLGAHKSDYLEQAPPNSFIYADDFDSIQDLAKYILKVADNKKLYDSYMKWKLNGYILQEHPGTRLAHTDVGVCRLLNYIQKRNSSLARLESFDPYGPNWLGGCDQCGEHAWIRNYSNWRS